MTVPGPTDISKQVLRLLGAFPEIETAVIFGSFAQGRAHPGSDLDLAVAADRPLSPERKVEIVNRLSSDLGREIDLIDLTETTGTVVKEAFRTGMLILNRNPLGLARILSRQIYEEEDFQKLRARLMEARRKKAFGVA